jgi:2-succinyl-6-hydroxy-2,4-cyclohexadiene-1-carboxylate synthase
MIRVCLHGFTGDPSVWDVVGRCVAEPLLGHAPHLLGDPGPEGFAREVDRLAARLPDAPVHLVGYSMGARLAAGLVTRHPARIARATLIGLHPGLADPRERAARLTDDERWIRLLENEGIERFADAWEAQPLFAAQPRVPAHQARRRSHDPHGLALALRRLGLAEMPYLALALGKSSVPLTLVVGGRDEKFQALARRVPARCVVIPDAGHDVVLEAPDALARLLEESA